MKLLLWILFFCFTGSQSEAQSGILYNVLPISTINVATDQCHCLRIRLTLAKKLANVIKSYPLQTNMKNLNLDKNKPEFEFRFTDLRLKMLQETSGTDKQ